MTDRIGSAGPSAVRPVSLSEETPRGVRSTDRESGGFAQILAEAQAGNVRFSKHAVERMERRQIVFSSDDLALLTEGINRAEQKGSRESLLLMGSAAFVVNIPERTVITAVDEDGMKDKTFTNIDSAILLSRPQG